MINAIRYGIVLPVVAQLFLLISCKIVQTEDFSKIVVTDGSDFVYQLHLNTTGRGTIILKDLEDKDVFLVKVNTTDLGRYTSTASLNAVSGEGSRETSIVETSIVETSGYDDRAPAGFVTVNGETLIRYERRMPVAPPSSPSRRMLSVKRSESSDFVSATVGDTKSFYVDAMPASTTKTAILKKIGAHCKVWVAGDNFNDTSGSTTDNKITQAQIDALADKFDAIYPLETNLLGYEYGGESGGNGGRDGDSHIQILVYDIDGDFGKPRNGITLGYFFSVDEYANGTYTDYYSNEAEIFYLDAEMLDREPLVLYSTLIHEFNHMINYNVKVMQTGNFANFESWYTEMLSMLAEDVIGPLVGIPYAPLSQNGNVINERIPYWLSTYASYGVMQWSNGNTLPYYSSNYAFGAYLVRNFGGPQLLSNIAKSNLGGEASLDAFLIAPNGSPATARYALSRFGEALVYSGTQLPAGICTFDKPAEWNTTVPGIGPVNYTFPAFNIWDIDWSIEGSGNSGKGPKTLDYTAASFIIPAKGIQLFSQSEWQNKTGNLTVQISNGNSAVSYYVMVR